MESNSQGVQLIEITGPSDPIPPRTPEGVAARIRMLETAMASRIIPRRPIPRRLYLEAGLEPPPDAAPDTPTANGDK